MTKKIRFCFSFHAFTYKRKKSEIKQCYFTKLMQILQNSWVFMTVKITVFIAVSFSSFTPLSGVANTINKYHPLLFSHSNFLCTMSFLSKAAYRQTDTEQICRCRSTQTERAVGQCCFCLSWHLSAAVSAECINQVSCWAVCRGLTASGRWWGSALSSLVIVCRQTLCGRRALRGFDWQVFSQSCSAGATVQPCGGKIPPSLIRGETQGPDNTFICAL